MFKDMVKQNRSYRSFDGSYEISKETLTDLIDCARFTPSSVNMQPFQYFISYKPKTNDVIFPLTAWARLLRGFDGPAPGHRPTAYIVICTDKTIGPNVERFRTDVGIVAQTIMLAAVEKGLGGCMIGNYNKEDLAAALHLPENLYPSLILAIGKPDETITLTELEKGGDTKYYRVDGKHYVPKRKLEDIVLENE